jgi:hypothetical protein
VVRKARLEKRVELDFGLRQRVPSLIGGNSIGLTGAWVRCISCSPREDVSNASLSG